MAKTKLNAMKKQINFIILISFFINVLSISAQNLFMIKGRVIDAETEESLPGVSIIIDKTTRGVTTDVDGTFEIRANPSDKLVFSSLRALWLF